MTVYLKATYKVPVETEAIIKQCVANLQYNGKLEIRAVINDYLTLELKEDPDCFDTASYVELFNYIKEEIAGRIKAWKPTRAE